MKNVISMFYCCSNERNLDIFRISYHVILYYFVFVSNIYSFAYIYFRKNFPDDQEEKFYVIIYGSQRYLKKSKITWIFFANTRYRNWKWKYGYSSIKVKFLLLGLAVKTVSMQYTLT
jgi:hypothetical protein